MGNLDNHQLHVFFFPFMAHGHMIPTMDMAKLFALRGVKATIVTTPLNVPLLSKSVARMKDSGVDHIGIQVLEFPSQEAGLPEGCENMDSITSLENGKELIFKFFMATKLLQDPLEKLLQEIRPDCIVADMFFPWTSDSAAKFGIPRLVFHGTSFFALTATLCVQIYQPHKQVASDSEPFIIPNLPGDIKLTRSQLPDFLRLGEENDFSRFMKATRESESKSYGVVVNSFYELEHDYADYYRNVIGRRAWHVGPVSLCNRAIEDKSSRGGKDTSINQHECLKWLDSKKPNSVIYICFGSMANFTSSQLKEIALALESSGHQFIWVVRRNKSNETEQERWLPENFESRMEGKGLIIRGWAPQVLILDHPAIGAFVTHCGWNSTLEAVTAGVPMVTWPVSAEQFYNEKLITDSLKIGFGVGVKVWVRGHGDSIKSEAIETAMSAVMVGEAAEEMRSRARKLSELARNSVEEGGSSYLDFNKLTQELIVNRNSIMKN